MQLTDFPPSKLQLTDYRSWDKQLTPERQFGSNHANVIFKFFGFFTTLQQPLNATLNCHIVKHIFLPTLSKGIFKIKRKVYYC